ncbi:hypothetical protein C9374_010852 [Naegleria lovaniensis]|uniref:Uncharacterized protein n=1 Tax=Naegleria lovaniensis TaxID=51637 RepID=A0AA88GAQ8_NAELO|nr:uncharacterized protein C9374_010852 [Naegleria lovaniensis]KAG2374282.1 hypothetical protein C9374_010852 [Naegleria lovaniensis]
MSPWNKLIPNWFSKLVLKNSDNNDHETNKTNSCFAQSEIPERRMTHPITGQVLLRLTAIKKDVGQHVVYQYETTSLTNPQLLIAICSNRELYGQPCEDCVTSLELKIYISGNNSNNSSISYQKQIEACRLCGLLDYFSSEQAAWTYLIEFLDGGEGYVKQHVARLDIGCLLELNEKRMIENFIVKKSATMSSEELVSYCVSCCHESMISDENVTEFHFDELKLFKSKFNINLRRKWMKIVYNSQELEYEECLIEDMPFLCYNTLIFNGEMILKSIFSFNTHFLEQVPEYSQDLVFKIDKRHFRSMCSICQRNSHPSVWVQTIIIIRK